jgi:phosphatidylglycerophosphate synthase
VGKKAILWVSLAIAVIVAVNELLWLGKTTLAWVILALTVALALTLLYLLWKESAMRIKPLYLGLLVVAVLMIAIPVKLLLPAPVPAPDLSANEVKAIVAARISSSSNYHVVSADYKGQGLWEVKVATPNGWVYWIFNEKTGKLQIQPTAPTPTPTTSTQGSIEDIIPGYTPRFYKP